jgi:hypothetical protein
MILARTLKNHPQAHVSHDLLRGCRNQEEIGVVGSVRGGACGGWVHVEVGLTERHRLSFEWFDPRAPSTLEKDTT